MSGFSLKLIESDQVQTTWWKPTEDYQKSVWWAMFNGQPVRHASLLEIDLWQRLHGGCDKLLPCLKPAGHAGGCNTSTAA